MDWIILADLIVMKEFLVIQAMSIMIIQEHLGLKYSYRVFPTATFVVTQYLKI